MKQCLIVTYGYLGDVIFASSVAEPLIKEGQYDAVDMLVGFPQVVPLLKQNPYIRNVFMGAITPAPQSEELESKYDKVFRQTTFTFEVPPPIEIQTQCGIKNPNAAYTVYTVPEVDAFVKVEMDTLRKNNPNLPIVCWLSTWKDKSFLFTDEEYRRGINVPYKGYGGKNRDIDSILKTISSKCILIEVGYPLSKNQFQLATDPTIEKSFAYEASVIKHADYFIGTEGGLANIACGVRTPTILTFDFVLQLYGWNGVIKKVVSPKLGPMWYRPEDGHVYLYPYLTDAQVAEHIIARITRPK